MYRDDVPPPSRFDPTKPLPPGWSLEQPAEGKPYFAHHDAPSYSSYYPFPTTYDWKIVPAETWGPVLRLITIRVFLHVDKPLCSSDEGKEEEDDGSDRFGMFSLVDSENEWVGVLHANIEPTDSTRILGERCELILLTSGLTYDDRTNDLELLKSYLPELASDVAENIPTGELYEFVNVMWIEWK